MAWGYLTEFLEYVYQKVAILGMAFLGDTDDGIEKYIKRKTTMVTSDKGYVIDLSDYCGHRKSDIDHYSGRHYTCTENPEKFTTTTKMLDENGKSLYDTSTRNGLNPRFNEKQGMTDADIDRIIADADTDQIEIRKYHKETGACDIEYTLKPEDQKRFGVGKITEGYGSDHFVKTRYPSAGVGTEFSESNVRIMKYYQETGSYHLGYLNGDKQRIWL